MEIQDDLPSATGVSRHAFNIALKMATSELIEIALGHFGKGWSLCIASVITIAAKKILAKTQLSTSNSQV